MRTVIVAPMTTGSRLAHFRIPLTFQGRQNLILLDQMRTLHRSRPERSPWSQLGQKPVDRRWWSLRLLLQYRNLYDLCMKTTLDLNDQLLIEAKALAAQQRTSLTRLIEEGLQLRLRAKAASARQGRVRLPVFRGRGGLVNGVDPLSNKALLEALGDDA